LKAIVLLSGGIDSAAALYWCREKGWETYALTFDYELEQSPELEAARRLAKAAGVAGHVFVDSSFYKGLEGSPSSHRGKIVDSEKGISQAYVPARNIVFFGTAAAYAEAIGAVRVVSGHNRGDAASFEPLVQRYSPRVFATARRYARRESEVEDIAQEVWLKAFEKLASYRGEAPFEHWLMRLTVRTCYDFLRAHQRWQRARDR
jgi:7-cyano-7-deazaguanine synthase in queuosine biosynthesis